MAIYKNDEEARKGIAKRMAEDRGKVAKVEQDRMGLIATRDDLARLIRGDLEKTLADLQTWKELKGFILDKPKVEAQTIQSLFAVEVPHHLLSLETSIRGMLDLIHEREN
jgi:hypothetical protein